MPLRVHGQHTWNPFISVIWVAGAHRFKPSLPQHQSNVLPSAIDASVTLCCLTKSADLQSAAAHAIRPKTKTQKSTSPPTFPLQNFLASTSCPEIQGYLYVKELGRKSWKKVYMFLRRSGLYCSTKGTSKVTEAHSFHLQRAELISIQQALFVFLS